MLTREIDIGGQNGIPEMSEIPYGFGYFRVGKPKSTYSRQKTCFNILQFFENDEINY